MRFLTAGSDGILVELADLGGALALLDGLQAERPKGVTELVPAARTLLLRFDPLTTTRAALEAELATRDVTPGPARAGRLIEIPVAYDGEDLAEVAELLGWSVETLIRRHAGAEFTVAFTGFAPGFAYMTCSDEAFDVPRRKSPRLRIPAGSVALAGKFGGIYPSDSPGGWQILGTTPLAMWDLSRPQPALLAPGDRVVFRDITKGGSVPVAVPTRSVDPAPVTPAITLLQSAAPVLVQDSGRSGQAAQGVATSGALDQRALRDLNRLLGNPPGTPALELTFGGASFRAEKALTLGMSGAPVSLHLETAAGARRSLPFGEALALDAGDKLHIGAPKEGMLSYLGLRGGFDIAPVLGSRSRDTLAKVGPEPLAPGAGLALGTAPLRPVESALSPRDLPQVGQIVTLDVHLGPRDDWFTEAGLARFTSQLWHVSNEISRTGKRLQGEEPLERRDNAELPSEATVPGAIQVPHSGQPVLFLKDHPLTGGYPVIACIADHHLDLAAQIPPGACIRFHPISKGA